MGVQIRNRLLRSSSHGLGIIRLVSIEMLNVRAYVRVHFSALGLRRDDCAATLLWIRGQRRTSPFKYTHLLYHAGKETPESNRTRGCTR